MTVIECRGLGSTSRTMSDAMYNTDDLYDVNDEESSMDELEGSIVDPLYLYLSIEPHRSKPLSTCSHTLRSRRIE
jgi:hypothetical protein